MSDRFSISSFLVPSVLVVPTNGLATGLAKVFALTALFASLAACPKTSASDDAGATSPDPTPTDAGGTVEDAGSGISGIILDGGAEICPTISPLNPISGSTCRTEGQRCGPEGCIAPSPGGCVFYLCQNGVWVFEVLANHGDAGAPATDAGQSTAGDAGASDAGSTAADAG